MDRDTYLISRGGQAINNSAVLRGVGIVWNMADCFVSRINIQGEAAQAAYSSAAVTSDKAAKAVHLSIAGADSYHHQTIHIWSIKTSRKVVPYCSSPVNVLKVSIGSKSSLFNINPFQIWHRGIFLLCIRKPGRLSCWGITAQMYARACSHRDIEKAQKQRTFVLSWSWQRPIRPSFTY